MPITLTRPIVHTYDVSPATGRTYQLNPEANGVRGEAPRLVGPGFNPPPVHVVRDPTNPQTHPDTGGSRDARPHGMRPMRSPVPRAASVPRGKPGAKR